MRIPRLDRPVHGMMLDLATRKDLDIAIFSIVLGMAYFVITGFPGTSPLFTAYLKSHLGISDSAFGVILTLPYITVLIQIPFTAYVQRHGRIKTSFLIAGSLSKATLLILALQPVVAPMISHNQAFMLVVVVILLTSSFNWIGDAAVNTWFGSMIPNEIKGRYFSTRQMIYTIAMLAFALLMSWLLPLLALWPLKYTFFFTFAVVFGLMDVWSYVLARPPEQAYLPWHRGAAASGKGFSREQFLAPLKDTRYRSYLGFAISWNFAMQISGPYYSIYQLEYLKYSLGMMTLMSQIIPAIATILFLRRIGQAFDRFGFRPVLILSCAVSQAIPFLWLFATPTSNWFLYPLNALSGTFNIGIDLAIMSLAIFLAPHEDRSGYLALKNVAMSMIGVVPAILIGGFISDWFKPILETAQIPFLRGQVMNSFHILLLLSFSLRLTSLFVFARRISEPTAMGFHPFMEEVQQSVRTTLKQNRRWFRQHLRRSIKYRIHK
jgi:MFS family permease